MVTGQRERSGLPPQRNSSLSTLLRPNLVVRPRECQPWAGRIDTSIGSSVRPTSHWDKKHRYGVAAEVRERDRRAFHGTPRGGGHAWHEEHQVWIIEPISGGGISCAATAALVRAAISALDRPASTHPVRFRKVGNTERAAAGL